LKASQLAEENNISLSAFGWSGKHLHFKLQIQIEYDIGYVEMLLLNAYSHGDISYCHWLDLMIDADWHGEEHPFTSLQRLCEWG
jgi:hypothetical protein